MSLKNSKIHNLLNEEDGKMYDTIHKIVVSLMKEQIEEDLTNGRSDKGLFKYTPIDLEYFFERFEKQINNAASEMLDYYIEDPDMDEDDWKDLEKNCSNEYVCEFLYANIPIHEYME